MASKRAARKVPAKQGTRTDYEVGYKKPPKATRWKPGQSGNPQGGRIMPKDQRELNALLDEIFAETVTDDHGRQMEKLRVALNRLLFSKNVAGVIHLLERRYGKVPQPIVGGGADDAHIQIDVNNGETVNRAISTLADALRESLSDKG